MDVTDNTQAFIIFIYHKIMDKDDVGAFKANAKVLHWSRKAGTLFWAYLSPYIARALN